MPKSAGALVVCCLPALSLADPVVQKDDHGFAAIADVDIGAVRGGATQPESLTEWTPLGPYGGDVQDVSASPTNGSIVLAAIAPNGSTGGTLYRSTDSGQTWAPVAGWSANSTYDIEWTSSGTAYVASFDGVWRSTNDGATWTNLPLGIGVNDQVFDVTIDPTDPNIIYASIADALGGQPNNVMKSTNGGTTWTNITPPGAAGVNGRAVAVNPTNHNQIVSAHGGSFGGGSVWFSSDGGLSWQAASGGLPNNPMTDVIYHAGAWYVCGGQLFGGQAVGLYRSTSPAGGWTPIHDGTWPNLIATDVEAIPGDTDGFLVATVNGVHRTTDGGLNWTISAGGTAPYSANSVRYIPGSTSSLFIGANSFGVARSSDNLASNTLSSVGIGALDVYSVEANPLNPDQLALAFQGLNNGGIYTSNDGGVTWNVETGLPGSRYNTVGWDNNTLYALNDGPTGGGVKEALYRKNGPGSWTSLGPDQGTLFESELFAMAFSSVNPGVIILGGSDFGVAGFEPTMWRFDPGTSMWTKTYEPVGQDNEDINTVLFVRDGVEDTLVAVYTDFSSAQTGGAIRSVDGGLSWNPADNGLQSGLQGYDLASVPGSPMEFLLADGDSGVGNGGIWRTTDAGQNWTRMIQAEGINHIAVDPGDADHVMVTTTFAAPRVRESVDGGATLNDFTQGLSTSIVCRDLSIGLGSSPAVYLGASSGVYQRDLPGGGCPADLTGASDPNDPTYGIPDGALDISDFFYFLDQFVAGNLAAADLTTTSDPNDPGYGVPDGALDGSDFFFYLDLFVAGCP